MNFYKLSALMVVLVVLLSACEPMLEITDLQIKETQDNPATEPSPTTIAVSEPQSMNQSIHGFGMGSSTNLRAPDIDQLTVKWLTWGSGTSGKKSPWRTFKSVKISMTLMPAGISIE